MVRVCSASSRKKMQSGVHGNTIVKDSIVGGVLLEVDDHLLGGSGSHITSALNGYEGRSSSESGIA